MKWFRVRGLYTEAFPFDRVIPLLEGVDPAGAAAGFSEGVLEIVMPKVAPPEAKMCRLEIREAKMTPADRAARRPAHPRRRSGHRLIS